MDQHIDAIYENGVLKPLQPLSLPEQAQVKIIVESSDTSDVATEDHVRQQQLANLKELLQTGLEQCHQGDVEPFNAEETKRRLCERLTKEGIE